MRRSRPPLRDAGVEPGEYLRSMSTVLSAAASRALASMSPCVWSDVPVLRSASPRSRQAGSRASSSVSPRRLIVCAEPVESRRPAQRVGDLIALMVRRRSTSTDCPSGNAGSRSCLLEGLVRRAACEGHEVNGRERARQDRFHETRRIIRKISFTCGNVSPTGKALRNVGYSPRRYRVPGRRPCAFGRRGRRWSRSGGCRAAGRRSRSRRAGRRGRGRCGRARRPRPCGPGRRMWGWCRSRSRRASGSSRPRLVQGGEPARVDAVGGDRGVRRRLHVRGREAELAAALVTADDHALDPVRAAEQPRRLRHVAGREQRPDGRGGDRHAVEHEQRQPLRRVLVLLAEPVEQRDVARRLVAEAEVLPHHDRPGVQPLDEHLADELVGVEPGEVEGEGSTHTASTPRPPSSSARRRAEQQERRVAARPDHLVRDAGRR